MSTSQAYWVTLALIRNIANYFKYNYFWDCDGIDYVTLWLWKLSDFCWRHTVGVAGDDIMFHILVILLLWLSTSIRIIVLFICFVRNVEIRKLYNCCVYPLHLNVKKRPNVFIHMHMHIFSHSYMSSLYAYFSICHTYVYMYIYICHAQQLLSQRPVNNWWVLLSVPSIATKFPRLLQISAS